MPLTGLISKYTAWRRSVYRRKVRDGWKMVKALTIPGQRVLFPTAFDYSAWKSDPQPLKETFKEEDHELYFNDGRKIVQVVFPREIHPDF